jgi:OPA family glycerol-3-phosphate transporter-like MFS transporter 3
MILIFRFIAAESIVLFFFMTCLVGMMVGSTCNIIASAISADLGQVFSHEANEDVMATVTGIIDGTGSTGAALGQLLIGWVSLYNWDYVFYIFIGSVLLAALMLIPVVIREIKSKRAESNLQIQDKEWEDVEQISTAD